MYAEMLREFEEDDTDYSTRWSSTKFAESPVCVSPWHKILLSSVQPPLSVWHLQIALTCFDPICTPWSRRRMAAAQEMSDSDRPRHETRLSAGMRPAAPAVDEKSAKRKRANNASARTKKFAKISQPEPAARKDSAGRDDDLNINGDIARMDGQLLSDYMVQKAKYFEKHLTTVELEDKLVSCKNIPVSRTWSHTHLFRKKVNDCSKAHIPCPQRALGAILRTGASLEILTTCLISWSITQPLGRNRTALHGPLSPMELLIPFSSQVQLSVRQTYRGVHSQLQSSAECRH